MHGRAVVFTPCTGVRAVALSTALRGLGWDVEELAEAAGVLGRVERGSCDLVAASAVPGLNRPALALARAIRERDRQCILLVLSEASSEDFLMDALRAGVSDILSDVATAAEIGASLARVAGNAGDAAEEPLLGGAALVGSSAPTMEVRLSIVRAARNDNNVLMPRRRA